MPLVVSDRLTVPLPALSLSRPSSVVPRQMPKLAEAKEELMPALQQLSAQVASIVQQQDSADDGGAEQAEGAEGAEGDVEIKVEVKLGDGDKGGDKDGNDEDDGRGEG